MLRLEATLARWPQFKADADRRAGVETLQPTQTGSAMGPSCGEVLLGEIQREADAGNLIHNPAFKADNGGLNLMLSLLLQLL